MPNYSVASDSGMPADKSWGTWMIPLVNTVGKATLLYCRCGITYSRCGHFMDYRDKGCVTPNTLSGKLLQGTALSFHVSLVMLLP
jgi:hypothetical protein